MEILTFQDLKTTPDIIHEYTSFLKENNAPIIIDNGSYQCRVGWANSDAPILTFKNLLAKPRKERSKKETVEIPQLQIGNDIVNIEAVRFQLKTQFDRNVVTHFEAQERLFDYTFMHLGIDTENNVPHPIVITKLF
ncbi:actin [Holotrichia oblita]|uniref:Actin n=1 Tax=Holotrichia oblita TaxID=644536 RepID=A0ACB9SWB3_HOLOL|nr:actin [Holotrichia oblita]